MEGAEHLSTSNAVHDENDALYPGYEVVEESVAPAQPLKRRYNREAAKRQAAEPTAVDAAIIQLAASVCNQDEAARIGERVADMLRKINPAYINDATMELTKVCMRYLRKTRENV
uniref:Uncharacterized protein n=1 Tax=Plectus sambesii TaxID=2011161 RepID=A0A914WLR2_9BILA